jgi:hypothetical protein
MNAYTRGSILERLDEVKEALSILSSMKGQLNSEVHQAVPNGISGLCDKDGNVSANVAQNYLKLRGYSTTAEGIRQAIRNDYAPVIREKDEAIGYAKGDEALAIFDEVRTNCSLSFLVNLPQSAMLLTSAKDDDGDFVVDAVASDGGSHPRNINIESTMALVHFGALSPLEMATKLSYNPSRMFGLLNKGHLGEGADADITIIDPERGAATRTFVAGAPVLAHGEIVATGGTLLVTAEGADSAKAGGLPHEIVDLAQSKLYAGFK